jgi:hypothetical protein
MIRHNWERASSGRFYFCGQKKGPHRRNHCLGCGAIVEDRSLYYYLPRSEEELRGVMDRLVDERERALRAARMRRVKERK